MSRRRLTGILLIVLAGAIAVPALALAADAPVPGASYTGVASDGAQVRFTVSPDGTLVDSYQLTGVQGNTCSLFANGDAGAWPGAPIEQSAFSYQLRTAITFAGSFTGPQSAAGMFDFHQDATSQTPACDTGTVSWTATTTAAPPPGQSGSNGSGSGGAGGGHRRPFVTRVMLRRGSAEWLTGLIASPVGACRAGRTVYLWRGNRRIGSTKAKKRGKFSFARSLAVRGRMVRASTPTRNVKTGVCAAASSKFIEG
jgi:hypothetical protein